MPPQGRSGNGSDRPGVVVHIDDESLGLATQLAEAARVRDLDVVLICPTGDAPAEHSQLAEVVETASLDVATLRAQLRRLERRYRIAGLSCSFGSFRPEGFVAGAVATLREEWGMAGPSAAALQRAANKLLAREALDAAGVPNVRFGLAEDEATLRRAVAQVGPPVVLKPLTGVGSSLIYRCASLEEAVASFRQALAVMPSARYRQVRMAAHEQIDGEGAPRRFVPDQSMLVEGYIGGREASVECVALDDQVIPLLVHDKIDVEECNATVREHLLVAPPCRFSNAEVEALKAYAVRCVRALGLRRTLCHVELRYDPALGPRLLEVNPRIGAGCVQDSLMTFLALDATQLQLDLITGEAIAIDVRPKTQDLHAMIFLFTERGGRLRAVQGLNRIMMLPGVKCVRLMCHEGAAVGGDTEEEFVAGIWSKVADVAAARTLLAKIQKRVKIDVDAGGP